MNKIHKLLQEIITEIKNDQVWEEMDWCPVCHEHPSHHHGGSNCALLRAENYLKENEK